jgi:hypothetical protein
MRKGKYSNFIEEPGLLGTLWNMIYGLFLFILVGGGFFVIMYAIMIGLAVIFIWAVDMFRAGAAIGSPYI